MGKVCFKCGEHPRKKNSSWCQPCHTDYNRAHWNGRSQEKRREKWLKSKYKITYAEYLEMFESQNGLCKICSKEISITSKANGHETACVDHCHSTLKIRGLLCNHCNRALGLMKDNKENIQRMLQYLEGTLNVR